MWLRQQGGGAGPTRGGSGKRGQSGEAGLLSPLPAVTERKTEWPPPCTRALALCLARVCSVNPHNMPHEVGLCPDFTGGETELGFEPKKDCKVPIFTSSYQCQAPLGNEEVSKEIPDALWVLALSG